MDPSQDFKSLQDKVQASLVSATKTVTRIASEDLGFQRTVNPSTGDRLEDQSTRLLSLSTDLLKSAAKATGQKPVGTLEDAEDVDLRWRAIVDVVDGLLEKADICLDEYTGLVKRKSDFPEPTPTKKAKTNDRLDYSVFRANIIKPQNAFEQKVDNFAPGPWKPVLTRKPHATVLLEDSLAISVDEKNNEQYDYTPFLFLFPLECRKSIGRMCQIPPTAKPECCRKKVASKILTATLGLNIRTKPRSWTLNTPRAPTRYKTPSHTSQSKRRQLYGSTPLMEFSPCWKN